MSNYRRNLIICKTSEPEPYILNGIFSVSATQKVKFSKGNLYYNGNVWNFEDNQHDYRAYSGMQACIGGVITTTPTNHWGSFCWSNQLNDYGKTTSGEINLTTFNEWGNNPIANGGNIGGMWRTLTGNDGESTYLLRTRSVNGGTGAGYSYQYTRLYLNDENTSSVIGILMAPDDYSGVILPTTMSMSDWKSFEEKGCVSSR